MTPRKHGNKWEINYWIPGYPKSFSERFESEKEALLRCAEIELAKSKGTLTPPVLRERPIIRSMSELLDEFVESYGTTHWGESYLSLAKHRIDDYIKPFLGDYMVRDITAEVLDVYYSKLLTSPAVHMKGHKKTGTVSFSVMEKCHTLIRTALNMAVRWGYISSNPAMFISLPKPATTNTRNVWSPEDALRALAACDKDPVLKLCIQLSIACSMRIGEILGLQWKDVHITCDSVLSNESYLEVRQELKRCSKESLRQLDEKHRCDVYLEFPSKKEAKSVLTLKKPKTESSIRRIYIPDSIAIALKETQVKQHFRKSSCHGLYQDYDLVIAQNDGKPVELRVIDKAFAKLIKENDLPEVVFHSLRHLSASLKLQYSGGDVKAVQGDTGHSQAKMVMQVYSHTFNQNRKRMAGLMESQFFSAETKRQPIIDDKARQVTELLKNSPELTDLILALGAKQKESA